MHARTYHNNHRHRQMQFAFNTQTRYSMAAEPCDIVLVIFIRFYALEISQIPSNTLPLPILRRIVDL